MCGISKVDKVAKWVCEKKRVQLENKQNSRINCSKNHYQELLQLVSDHLKSSFNLLCL